MDILPPEITRVHDRPVRCSISLPEPISQDPREQRVLPEPRAVPVSIFAPARPNKVSIAYAKKRASEERAEVDAEIRSNLRRSAKANLRELIDAHGALLVRTLLDELEAERG